jgi:type IV pilus assembly protein PilE
VGKGQPQRFPGLSRCSIPREAQVEPVESRFAEGEVEWIQRGDFGCGQDLLHSRAPGFKLRRHRQCRVSLLQVFIQIGDEVHGPCLPGCGTSCPQCEMQRAAGAEQCHREQRQRHQCIDKAEACGGAQGAVAVLADNDHGDVDVKREAKVGKGRSTSQARIWRARMDSCASAVDQGRSIADTLVMACRACRRRANGVTLVEMLVGLVVLGIIVAAAIPAHRAYVVRANRSEARRDLLALAEQLHRCFERAEDYRVDSTGSPNPCVKLPSTNAEGTYTVAFAPGEPRADGFKLVATPAAQAADSGCGALTLDERGNRGITGGSDAAQACWQGPGD